MTIILVVHTVYAILFLFNPIWPKAHYHHVINMHSGDCKIFTDDLSSSARHRFLKHVFRQRRISSNVVLSRKRGGCAFVFSLHTLDPFHPWLAGGRRKILFATELHANFSDNTVDPRWYSIYFPRILKRIKYSIVVLPAIVDNQVITESKRLKANVIDNVIDRTILMMQVNQDDEFEAACHDDSFILFFSCFSQHLLSTCVAVFCLRTF